MSNVQNENPPFLSLIFIQNSKDIFCQTIVDFIRDYKTFYSNNECNNTISDKTELNEFYKKHRYVKKYNSFEELPLHYEKNSKEYNNLLTLINNGYLIIYKHVDKTDRAFLTFLDILVHKKIIRIYNIDKRKDVLKNENKIWFCN